MPPDPFIVSEAVAGVYLEGRSAACSKTTDARSPKPSSASAREREAAEARKAQEADRAAYHAEHETDVIEEGRPGERTESLRVRARKRRCTA